MKQRNLVRVLSGLLCVCALWTESLLPIFVIFIIFDVRREKSFIKRARRYLKEYFGIRFRWVEWFISVIVSVWFVSFLYSSFFGIYTFHTSSMSGTLNAGDLLFVNKMVPGARRFANNVNWYHRIIGMGDLKRKDVIIFNFPEGDTLLKERPTESYYYLKRIYGGAMQLDSYNKLSDIQYKKVKERPRFVKRVYGLPGDSLLIKDGECFVNNIKVDYPEYSVERYVISEEQRIELEKGGVKPYNELTTKDGLIWELYNKDVVSCEEKGIELKKDFLPQNYPDPLVFPFSTSRLWNMNNMGSVYIPAKGVTIKLTSDNISLYSRIISVFEGNDLQINGDDVLINDKKVSEYTFKMNYYWVMGDNLPHSFDSRFWGFVPENHIVGKVEKVILSKDIHSNSMWSFRGERFMKSIN